MKITTLIICVLLIFRFAPVGLASVLLYMFNNKWVKALRIIQEENCALRNNLQEAHEKITILLNENENLVEENNKRIAKASALEQENRILRETLQLEKSRNAEFCARGDLRLAETLICILKKENETLHEANKTKEDEVERTRKGNQESITDLIKQKDLLHKESQEFEKLLEENAKLKRSLKRLSGEKDKMEKGIMDLLLQNEVETSKHDDQKKVYGRLAKDNYAQNLLNFTNPISNMETKKINANKDDHHEQAHEDETNGAEKEKKDENRETGKVLKSGCRRQSDREERDNNTNLAAETGLEGDNKDESDSRERNNNHQKGQRNDYMISKLENKNIYTDKFILMRHGERLDSNWPTWYHYFIEDMSTYKIRTSGNFKTNTSVKFYCENILPAKLPLRPNMMDYKLDTPLTPRGIKKAIEIGENMSHLRIAVTAIYSSPAFRCIQTADAIAIGAGINTSHPIHIEPGLYEGSPFILPYMTADELKEAGFNIQTGYLPLMKVEDINGQEGEEEFYYRQVQVTEHILRHASTMVQAENECTLIIAHQENIGAVSHILTGQDELQRYAEFESTDYLFHELVTKRGSSWERELLPLFDKMERDLILNNISDFMQDPTLPSRLSLPLDNEWEAKDDIGKTNDKDRHESDDNDDDDENNGDLEGRSDDSRATSDVFEIGLDAGNNKDEPDDYKNESMICKLETRIYANKFILMRHGERLDSNWPLWYYYIINEEKNTYNLRISGNFKTNISAKYYSENIFPAKLPFRQNMMDYELDTPLTPRGIKKAVEIGENMSHLGVPVTAIYSSPAFRCIQTAYAIAIGAGINTSHPIHIEPGLYEGSPFILPHMTADELKEAGFNIQTRYLPLMKVEDINGQEGEEEFYCRQVQVTEHILQHASTMVQAKNECTLIIAHQENIGTVSHISTGQSKLQQYAEFKSTGYLFHELVTKNGSSWERELLPLFDKMERDLILNNISDLLQDPSLPSRLRLPSEDKQEEKCDSGKPSDC